MSNLKDFKDFRQEKLRKLDIHNVAKASIDKESAFLNHISQEIWKHPELKYEEKFAHNLLTDALQKKGFVVEKHFALPTAFRAEFDSGKPGPSVAVICEYDALPNVGHACGHNLIAEAGLGAAIGIKTAMETSPEIPGKVIVLGTPAEEAGGGKIDLIKAGVFENIDAALMVHPTPEDYAYPSFIGSDTINVQYTGKEAHSSGYPWEGVNALDAAVICYNNIAFLRQHIKPTCRLEAIISKGGEAPNVITGFAELQLICRASSTHDMENLRKRVTSCIESAAHATGCDFEIKVSDCYSNLVTNAVLAERYKKYAEGLGVHFEDENRKKIPLMASSDMGNVSLVVPSIHPTYSIGTRAVNHSLEFSQASAAPAAQATTLTAAKSMAMLVLDLMCDQDFLNEVKEQFKTDLADDAGL